MQLKKVLLSMALTVSTLVFAGSPPTIMFLPDKQWCNENGYVIRSERNGKTRVTENYDEAFLNADLKNVITTLNGLIQAGDDLNNKIEPKTYGESSELDDEEEAEEELFEGDGFDLKMTPYEAALQKLRPDIIIKLGWNVNKSGFNYMCDYRLEAIDSYSGKSIAVVTATTPQVKAVVPLSACLKNAATEHMSNFKSKLLEHFDGVQENGREITLRIGITSGSDATMDTDYNGEELSQIIHNWLHDNTVNHAFSERGVSKNKASYEQIRIPLKDSQGKVYQAKQFVDDLKKHIKSKTGLRAENATKGLGSGRLYIVQ